MGTGWERGDRVIGFTGWGFACSLLSTDAWRERLEAASSQRLGTAALDPPEGWNPQSEEKAPESSSTPSCRMRTELCDDKVFCVNRRTWGAREVDVPEDDA